MLSPDRAPNIRIHHSCNLPTVNMLRNSGPMDMKGSIPALWALRKHVSSSSVNVQPLLAICTLFYYQTSLNSHPATMACLKPFYLKGTSCNLAQNMKGPAIMYGIVRTISSCAATCIPGPLLLVLSSQHIYLEPVNTYNNRSPVTASLSGISIIDQAACPSGMPLSPDSPRPSPARSCALQK